MAASSAPLVWDFYRDVGADVDVKVGGVVHFYDEQAQSLFLNGGLKTRTSTVSDGQWKTAVMSEPSTFINTNPYTSLGLDHPCNGILYGVAAEAGKLVFLRYVYSMDISDLMDSWNWTSQNDNAIAQFSCSIQNLGPDIFSYDATLFQPGARITVAVRMGPSATYPIGVAWIDECNYDISADTVDLSGRNTVGRYLKDQTFDDLLEFTGLSSEIMANVLAYAGVTKCIIQPGEGTKPFIFEPSDTILDGIQTMLSFYTDSEHEWNLVELPDGTIVVGYANWRANYLPNSYYTFNEGSEVFKRKTTKLSDSSYTSLRVTGKDANKEDLIPVMVPITNFKYWALGTHRTQHITAPEGLTQEGMQAWAEALAEKYQYIGIGEDFAGPFRPQLLVGDIAEVIDDEIGVSLGLITEVRQIFTRQEGFKTEFSVDSGGVMTDGDNYTVYSRAAEVSGFNRRQRIIDLVRFVAKH